MVEMKMAVESSQSLFSHRSRRSTCSSWSVLSVASTGSVLSFASAGSILSICSAGSILSFGSAGSILSFGSAGSILSVRSSGKILSTDDRPQRDLSESTRKKIVGMSIVGVVLVAASIAHRLTHSGSGGVAARPVWA